MHHDLTSVGSWGGANGWGLQAYASTYIRSTKGNYNYNEWSAKNEDKTIKLLKKESSAHCACSHAPRLFPLLADAKIKEGDLTASLSPSHRSLQDVKSILIGGAAIKSRLKNKKKDLLHVRIWQIFIASDWFETINGSIYFVKEKFRSEDWLWK